MLTITPLMQLSLFDIFYHSTYQSSDLQELEYCHCTLYIYHVFCKAI
jgi:hypothetical protein